MMRFRYVACLIVLAAAPALQAQTLPPGLPDPAALEEVRQRAQRMMNPVAFALEHRSRLGLSDAQVAALEPEGARLGEMQVAVMQRTQEAMRQTAAGMTDPRASVDLESVRAAYRAKAEVEADVAIRLMEVHRLIAHTLDAHQRATLQQLQMAAAMEMMRSLPVATPR